MRKASVLILFLLLCSFWVVFSNTGIINAESNSLVTVKDEHFIIREVLGAFNNFFVGSFNASGGYWIELDLSCQSTDNGPFIVYLDILSATHGSILSAKETEFSQTVYLDYEDVYNITIAKSPFYSSVRINGIIDVFHQEPSDEPSENWVEVERFSGGSWWGGTRLFRIDNFEWRIRWNYEPSIDFGSDNAVVFDIQVLDAKSKRVELVRSDGKTNGTVHLHQSGQFYLYIIGFNTNNYTIIIEQNIDSVPEFSSWIILPLILIITLFSVVVKRNMKRV